MERWTTVKPNVLFPLVLPRASKYIFPRDRGSMSDGLEERKGLLKKEYWLQSCRGSDVVAAVMNVLTCSVVIEVESAVGGGCVQSKGAEGLY